MPVLEERVAIITGSSRGIGAAIADTFAQEGARVVVNYSQSREEAETIARVLREKGREAIAVQADVSLEGDVRRLVEVTVDHFGRIDILVNNAGLAIDMPIQSMGLDSWRRVLDVNLTGTFLCSQAVAEVMWEQENGKIINVSAATGLQGRKNGANYCAAKGGVISLTKCFALEYAPFVQVNCLLPGFTRTEDVMGRFNLHDPVVMETMLNKIPLRRLATPADIAQGALVLAGQMSDYMTGQLLCVNGGSFM